MTTQEHETIEVDSRIPSDEISSQLSIKGIILNDQLNGDDSAPKARKPYTITKQRERWTEEDHTKFLEALKLYGRAWRKIEEHVGTKTAVQIRSHAQKFFTKVVRESSTGGDSSSEKPIEIPPPRPKRKPTHPYPRKQQVSRVTKGISIPEKITFSSLDLSVSELENQSPTSVLSAICSETSSDEDVVVRNCSPSNVNTDTVLDSQTANMSAEYELSSKVEISTSNMSLFHEKGSTSSFLKLFGKTLLVKEPQESYNMVFRAFESESSEKSDVTCLIPRMVQFPVTDSECTQDLFQNGNPIANNTCQATLSWLTLSFPTIELHNPTPVKASPLYEHREGSSSGSNSAECSLESKETAKMSFSSCKLNSRVAVKSIDCPKGFVPYKRCLADNDSSETVDPKGFVPYKRCLADRYSSETVESQQKRRIHPMPPVRYCN